MKSWKVLLGLIVAFAVAASAYFILPLRPKSEARQRGLPSPVAQQNTARDMTRLRERLDRVERAGQVDPRERLALAEEIRRLESRLEAIEASAAPEIEPESRHEAKTGAERAEEMRGEFRQEIFDATVTGQFRELADGILRSTPELTPLTFQSVHCSRVSCLVEASVAEGATFESLYPSMLYAFAHQVTATSFAMDRQGRQVTLSVTRKE